MLCRAITVPCHTGARPTAPLRPRRAAASLHSFISCFLRLRGGTRGSAPRFVERRRGHRSAIAPSPNFAPPHAVLADVRSSVSALSVRRVPDAAARTGGRRCLCSWTSRRRAPPRRSPAYSPSSPAARGSVAPWPSFAASPIASLRYAWRYELLLGEVSRPPLRHLTSRPPYAVLADVRSSASTFS